VCSSDLVAFFSIYLILAGLLPVNLLAIKILNYDLFSFLLGALSVVLIGIGLRQKEAKWILLGVITAFFAAQEKLIAAPILWFSIFAYAWLRAEKAVSGKASAYLARFLGGFSGAFFCAVSANVFTYLILWLNRFGDMPASLLYPHVFLSPFSSALWPVIRAIGGDVFIKQYGMFAQTNPFIWLLLFLSAIFIGACLIAVISLYIKKALPTLGKMPLVQRISGIENAGIINTLLFLITFVVALLAYFLVNGYLSSIVPVQAGAYHPSASFNQNTLHFGARTMIGHYILQIAWAYLDFIISFPTALVLIILWCGISEMRDKISGKKHERFPLFFDALFFICLCMPIFYAVTQTPTASRYFNLFVFIIACITSIRFSIYLNRFSGHIQGAICFAVLIIALAEVLPFRPLYGAFRPWWYGFNKGYAASPELTTLKPGWLGWGEEMMLAGKWIRKNEKGAGTQQRPVMLYMNYLGEWFGKGAYVKTGSMLDKAPIYKYTENDFYIINRSGLLINHNNFPKGIQPLCVVSFRGFNQAWVYRGDHLAQADFHFPSLEKVHE
jgi:hypothetical protein